MTSTLPGTRSPAELRAYISDALGQLADLARLLNDRRLETSMRLLSLEVEADLGRAKPQAGPETAH